MAIHAANRVEVVQEVQISGRASENANRSMERSGVACRVLQRRPGAFKKYPLLGIHQRRLTRVNSEERRIEALDVVQHTTRLYVRRISQQVLGHRFLKLLVREERDRFDAVFKIAPELGGGQGSGKTACDSDYRDLLRSSGI